MKELAEKYAELKGTKIIASHTDGDKIIFVFESGHKYTMTAGQLTNEISKMTHALADLPSKSSASVRNKVREEIGSDGGAVAPPPADGSTSPEPTEDLKPEIEKMQKSIHLDKPKKGKPQ